MSARTRTSPRSSTSRHDRSDAISRADSIGCVRRWSADMTPENEVGASVDEQAAYWWDLLNSDDVTAAEQREFAEWVSRSPERVAACLRVARLYKQLNSGAFRWPDASVAELVEAAKRAPAEVLPLPVAAVARVERP